MSSQMSNFIYSWGVLRHSEQVLYVAMENTIIIMVDLEYSIAQKQTYKVFCRTVG